MKKIKTYCIRNEKKEYWNNEFGWILPINDFEEFPFSIFTEEEKKKYNLPIGGKWQFFAYMTIEV